MLETHFIDTQSTFRTFIRFGHLSDRMLRACRLVIDTGIHMYGWSVQQSEDMLRENTAMSEPELQSEAKRYVTVPGQACAYMIGFLKLKDLREVAESTLGSKFDIKDFHDEVLKSGNTSMEMLEQKITSYIQNAAAEHT